LRSRSKGCAVVVGPAVELDDELVLWPESVDLVAGDVLVDQRAWEPVPVDEGEERVLEMPSASELRRGRRRSATGWWSDRVSGR